MKKNDVAIIVNDKMQKDYRYCLTEIMGKNFHPDFKPELTPQEMLELGVFGGKYISDCQNEFPKDWYKNAKLSPYKKNPAHNFFGVDASQPLSEWIKKAWINPVDPRGWFQWYCRYYLGRRIPDYDNWQIKRWKNFARHLAQVKINCFSQDWNCRRRQRQALLHWAYDSRKI